MSLEDLRRALREIKVKRVDDVLSYIHKAISSGRPEDALLIPCELIDDNPIACWQKSEQIRGALARWNGAFREVLRRYLDDVERMTSCGQLCANS